MADGYNLTISQRDLGHSEVLNSPRKKSPSIGPNFGAANEAMMRGLSEFDLAAYDKADLPVERTLKRFFDSFDCFQHGYVTRDEFAKLTGFLGVTLSDEEQTAIFCELGETVTFEAFFAWWQKNEQKETAFAVVQANFAAPFHQQQLEMHESGVKFTPSYRCNYTFRDVETGEISKVSPWHDIPLYVRDLVRTIPADVRTNRFNFICEIPKWTRAKFEISTKEEYNPIKQDMKDGVPRFYKHGDMMWNYGAFPQTWESTEHVFLNEFKGDNDPLDAIEIGMTQMGTGALSHVKVLGVLGMIDDGEMDWKVICISHTDPVAKFIDDITDVPKFLPGCLDAVREWLRVYKICQGGEETKFAFDGDFQDKAYALSILHESNLMWSNLTKVAGKSTC
jgi:inorganic pyrophosphatase